MKTHVAYALLSKLEAALKRFGELDQPEAVIAFSGGKDSVSLAVGLRELGKRVSLRAVDMGYSAQWEGRIRHLAGALKLPVEVIRVEALLGRTPTESVILSELRKRRAELDVMAPDDSGITTPCTNCYNCKILSLIDSSAGSLYFGHHQTDLISSFLKSAIMYYDRWVLENQQYDRARFRKLALSIAADFSNPLSNYQKLFLNYLSAGLANTSEPAVESGAFGGVDYKIYRPLLLASEQECAEFAGHLGVALESSGCGHTNSMGARTAREIIQYEMLPKIFDLGGAQQIDQMARLVIDALQDGHANADVRRSRVALLGPDYKTLHGGLGDKL